ncbi:hypothetical protein RND64_04525 [Gordonia sp. w5E2]|uniref:hypothetical protein n=1 Tax=Gordonia sp. w5E2 TaxID=3075837 RepID=UPI002F4027C8
MTINKAVTVTAVSSTASNDEEVWTITLTRHRAGNRYYSPDPARIPDDVRNELQHWTAGVPI